ncbi:hypothetical protein GQ53DRAFT_725278 [Thozetella sp. PMI_491]|nr:hypothetical protein GQ53DRAFT_725278 [Thozetella sp. PMI_491]
MEFIVIECPGEKASAASKRQAHSHAARVAHARNRRKKEAEHAKQKETAERYSHSGDSRHSQPPDENQRDEEVGQENGQASIRDNGAHCVPRHITGAFEHQTLARFIKSLTSREQLMFHHYIQVVVPYMCHYCPVPQHSKEFHQRMRGNWVLLCSTDVDLLKGFLLAACRHLSAVHSEKEYSQFAEQYKLNHLQTLREAVLAENPSMIRKAIATAVVLAFDEIMLGDMKMAAKHIQGASHLAQMAGGPQALGLNSFASYFLHSCIYGKRLLDSDPKVNCGSDFMTPRVVAV